MGQYDQNRVLLQALIDSPDPALQRIDTLEESAAQIQRVIDAANAHGMHPALAHFVLSDPNITQFRDVPSMEAIADGDTAEAEALVAGLEGIKDNITGAIADASVNKGTAGILLLDTANFLVGMYIGFFSKSRILRWGSFIVGMIVSSASSMLAAKRIPKYDAVRVVIALLPTTFRDMHGVLNFKIATDADVQRLSAHIQTIIKKYAPFGVAYENGKISRTAGVIAKSLSGSDERTMGYTPENVKQMVKAIEAMSTQIESQQKAFLTAAAADDNRVKALQAQGKEDAKSAVVRGRLLKKRFLDVLGRAHAQNAEEVYRTANRLTRQADKK